jgi:hypothetical protein
MITLQQIEVMFNEMRAENKWDLDGPLVWRYFFTDHNREKLLAAASALERMNYRVVGILEPSPDDDDKELMFLRVEKKLERHTPQTLNSRNIELYRFAEQFGLESYDGMDAGLVLKK